MKVKNWSFNEGIFLLIFFLIGIFILGSLPFCLLILIIFSIMIIIENLVRKEHRDKLTLLFLFLVLISALLWIAIGQIALDVIFALILSIFFIILWILRFSGYIPEKWF
ncbi:hypothetical protein [Methanobacterium alcaliphilum]|uniref:hypothetical protein n=1 Tax=Methanobacterium alcaliphilum TaxID=392018 RepID=UPI00200B7884|nr:hypothetical protein [Methanobacterium alcaliphilum]MCK9151839.1 hypothetical protein [Methanobacterium alcaliphilum]